MRTLKPAEISNAILALFVAARAVRQNAYEPNSHFQVGAALEDIHGNIHVGCNVENATHGLTTCAERNALTTMVGTGVQQVKRICVVLDGGADPGGSPCGACRQVIWEFARGNKKLPIVLADPNGRMRITTIGELLCDPFEYRK